MRGYSCLIDVCQKCPAGSYSNSSLGITDVSQCTTCSSGYYSSTAGAISCDILCPAGSYVTDSSDDDDGYGVTRGGTACVQCPEARYTASGSTQCDNCAAGKTSNGNTTKCIDW